MNTRQPFSRHVGSDRNNSRFSRGNSFNRPRTTKRQKTFHPSLFIKRAQESEITTFIPQNQFNDFALLPLIKKNIEARGYKSPTPIQDGIIPHVLEGRDVVGIANTGTGKTAAFLLPLIHKVLSNPNQKVLIIAPTRELAIQIEDELFEFAKNTPIVSVLCIGGANMRQQKNRLYRKHDFVIGTAGRLLDLEQSRALRLNEYASVVLDEVDRMLDMGFIRDMQYIIAKLPKNRHSLFFSATLPTEVQNVMKSFLNNPITITIKSSEPTAKNVDQDVVYVKGRNRVDVLHDLLIQDGFKKVLIFGRTKHGMNKLTLKLVERGFKVAAIHGNKSQSQRQMALDSFKSDKVQILLATDIASRGLDIDDITHVINYDLPETYEDYIHRIGRTGRAEKKGNALTFID